MDRTKEHLNIDLYFEEREMTEEDQKRVSDFIAESKLRQKVFSGSRNGFTDEEMNALHQRVDAYMAGETETFTVDQSHNKIREERRMR